MLTKPDIRPLLPGLLMKMNESRKIEVFYLPETGKVRVVVDHDGGSVSFTISPEKWNKLVVDTSVMMAEMRREK